MLVPKAAIYWSKNWKQALTGRHLGADLQTWKLFGFSLLLTQNSAELGAGHTQAGGGFQANRKDTE